jgi:drug/metabolite transporter (DMT)-like permease
MREQPVVAMVFSAIFFGLSTPLCKLLLKGLSPAVLAVAIGHDVPLDRRTVLTLLVGAAGYGASLVLFIKALKGLGAVRSGAFFSLAPFIGGISSLVILSTGTDSFCRNFDTFSYDHFSFNFLSFQELIRDHVK